jgi:para-nitrobenzyl esterase
MLAALKWVQANIAQFGGDPSRVTIFGGSAGALAVSLLAGAPAANGLYSRAIAVGGAGFFPKERGDLQGFFPPHSRRGAEMIGEAFFKSLGAADLRSARALPANAVLNVSQSKPWGIGAIVDGDLVQRSNTELFEEGRFNDTPILIGFTSDEWGDPPPETSAHSVQAEIDRLPCKKTHAAIHAAYPHASDAQAKISARYLQRDLHVGWGTWTWARLQKAKGRHGAYVYFFDVHGPEHPFGAPHATEYPYMFGRFPTPPTAAEEATSALIRSYWINFATHGNPNGPGLPVWKAFDEDSQMAMVFTNTASSRQLPNLDGLKALDASLLCHEP